MTWRQLGPRRGKRRGLLRGAVTIPEGLEERSFSLPPTPQSRSRRNQTPPGGKNRSHLSRGVVFHSGSLTPILFPSYTTGYTALVNHPTPVHAASVCVCTPPPPSAVSLKLTFESHPHSLFRLFWTWYNLFWLLMCVHVLVLTCSVIAAFHDRNK